MFLAFTNADVLQVWPLKSDKTAGASHGEDRRQEGSGRNRWSGPSQAEKNVSFDPSTIDHRFKLKASKNVAEYNKR